MTEEYRLEGGDTDIPGDVGTNIEVQTSENDSDKQRECQERDAQQAARA